MFQYYSFVVRRLGSFVLNDDAVTFAKLQSGVKVLDEQILAQLLENLIV